MAIKVGNKYKCPYCNFTDSSYFVVDNHRDAEHDIVLVPLIKSDIIKLLQYFITGDQKLISKDLYKTLQIYSRHKSKEEPPKNDKT